MVATTLLFVIFFVILSTSASKYFPSYVQPCSRSDPNFQKCCLERGNVVLPVILKGDKQLNIPKMLPLRFPKIDADAGPSLQFHFTDVDFWGLETFKLTDINVSFETNKVDLAVHSDRVSLVGQYEVDGKIMVLPIKGHGPLNITFYDCIFNYSFLFKLGKKGGEDYATMQNDDTLEYKIGKTHFELGNLFDGNKQMGDNVLKFLNDNDADVIKELGGPIEDTVKVIARTIAGNILAKVPINDLFLK